MVKETKYVVVYWNSPNWVRDTQEFTDRADAVNRASYFERNRFVGIPPMGTHTIIHKVHELDAIGLPVGPPKSQVNYKNKIVG